MDASAWTGRASGRVASASIAAIALLTAACARQTDSFDYSGTLQADSASIGSTAGGRVTSLAAADGERVRAGGANEIGRIEPSLEDVFVALTRARTSAA